MTPFSPARRHPWVLAPLAALLPAETTFFLLRGGGIRHQDGSLGRAFRAQPERASRQDARYGYLTSEQACGVPRCAPGFVERSCQSGRMRFSRNPCGRLPCGDWKAGQSFSGVSMPCIRANDSAHSSSSSVGDSNSPHRTMPRSSPATAHHRAGVLACHALWTRCQVTSESRAIPAVAPNVNHTLTSRQ